MGALEMFNEARQLPSISISLPTIFPSSNSTFFPSSSSSASITTSDPSSASITSTSASSSSSDPLAVASDITSATESKNLTSDPLSSFSSTSTTAFIAPTSFSSSFSSATVTENITTIITSINGQGTTITSHLPTSLVGLTPPINRSPRITIIASVTAGSIVLLCLALACVFGHRRHKLRRTLALLSNQKKKEGKGLLDGEDFDDDDHVVPIRSYQDQYLVAARSGASASAVPRSVSPAPSLIRSRVSESGSIFREEIWPPPGFVDPIAKKSSQVDLSRIVDDVMGPSSSTFENVPSTSSRPGHNYLGSIGSNYGHSNFPSTSHERDATGASGTSGYSQLSVKSTTPLIPAVVSTGIKEIRPIQPPPSSYIDPFASQNNPPSVYYPSSTLISLPPGALAPATPGQSPIFFQSSPVSVTANNTQTLGSASAAPPLTAHDTRSVSPTPSASRLYSSSTAQPKMSSPLARALTGDARIWLGRSLHPPK